MFKKKRNLKLEVVKTLDRDYWGEIIMRTRKALSNTPRKQGRVIKANFQERTFKLLHQKVS